MLFDLPPILGSKIFINNITNEQKALMKIRNNEPLDKIDNAYLLDAINFYDKCIPKLLAIDYATIEDKEADFLKDYFNKALSVTPTIFNEITFYNLFRVTKVEDEFLSYGGKVRHISFLKNPGVDVLRKINKYNRASGIHNSVFYASFYENVAVMETKPPPNSRIILTKWYNISNHTFQSYPIPAISPIESKPSMLAAAAVDQLLGRYPPIPKMLLSQLTYLISHEFTKKIVTSHPRRYEYLISSFFGDRILENVTGESECIIYPSVAWNHRQENLAVSPKSVDSFLIPIEITEYFVKETFYDANVPMNEMPVKLELVRKGKKVGDNIIWSDD